MRVGRSIHQNPFKVGLTSDCEYMWSSYNEYLSLSPHKVLCSMQFILDMFDSEEAFIQFHKKDEDTYKFYDIKSTHKTLSDQEALTYIEQEFGTKIL